MATTWGNDDVASFFTTKHSWRGKYKRIFSIGTKAVTTYNPTTLEVTNQWSYGDFFGISPSAKAPNEFIISVKKGKEGKKSQTMTFSTEHRAEVLTEGLRMRSHFGEYKGPAEPKYNAYKHHWSDNRIPITLQITACSLDQLDPTTNKKLTSYDYKDMEGISLVSDYPGGFVVIYGGFSRLHLLACDRRDELIKKMQDMATATVGLAIKKRKEPITLSNFMINRLGKYSDDESITSLTEFRVQKITPRCQDPVPRIFSLSESCLIERDIGTYSVVCVQPLSTVFAIIRYTENPQLFAVEYMRGVRRRYLCTDRDALLASLLDGVRASGNEDVHVKMQPTKRGLRMAPLYCHVDEEVESHHLRFLAQPPGKFFEAVARFNSNISYSGLLHAVTQDTLFAENKERLIVQALQALLANEYDVSSVAAEDLEAVFHALRRLVASKAGFEAFTTLNRFRERVGVKVVKALKRDDDGVTHAAVDMLAALMQPMHENYDLRQEQLNKSSLLSSRKFLEDLLDIFSKHVMHETGALVISALLDFLTFALCPPYSETTDGTQFDTLLEMVAGLGRCLFRLFQNPSVAIVKGAGMVMKAVIEEGDAEVAAKMQDLALAEGALPRHLHTAMYTMNTVDSRLLTNRQLSRHLVGLWVTGHPTALALLKRILPAGMLSFLDSTDKVPESELERMQTRDNVKLAEDSSKVKGKLPIVQLEKFLTHWKERVSEKVGIKGKRDQLKEKPVVLRKRRQRIKSEANWDLFYYKFNCDHSTPMLIWNNKTREELKDALEAELRVFTMDKDISGKRLISWNHAEFEVHYLCLQDEIKIGDYYLRVLLEEEADDSPILNAVQFFNDLYHRFLLSTKSEMKAMCLQAMAKVYGRCYEEIGSFHDTRYIVEKLDKAGDKMERDRLLLFLRELMRNKLNVKMFIDASGIRLLVDLVVLAHLHTSRATVPMQTAMIEAGPNMELESEKEWYYGNVEKERLGPFSLGEMKSFWKENIVRPTTRCWSQGLDGWRPLQNITQLKWSLMATAPGIMNETELACVCLEMLIKICDYYPNRDSDGAIVRPLPRAKRMLSDASCLPHIVQLLLTFDPSVVERVSALLTNAILDNPVMPRLYQTGVFFFIMMYTGSNVIPIGRFLQETHMKQAFRADDNQSSEIQIRSILGQLLPEAMVCYLENYGAEKFAEIFLGEFDTPEAIWSGEMRRLMIEKIATHIADYTPRLHSNVRALYQYCPIPSIQYPQLENELFCNIYYLRHLCDTARFPDWDIKDPVKLLKDILEAWKKEVEKKPPTLTLDDAYEVLGLKKGQQHNESAIRRAYFKLAQKYHPDKNPDGREIFDQVSKAYEFLGSKSAKRTEGPDPENIVLILKSQSILFRRYRAELSPYKYAGYPMLIKTIRLENEDSDLFKKETPLLPAATELAFHTINCSALNAEELRRENGIEVLQQAFSRCVSILHHSTAAGEVTVQVCRHVARCYSAAAQFEGCREKITEIPTIVSDLCRILYFRGLTQLACVVTECISNFSVDFWLQTHLLQSGAVWHLLLALFQYDYTLAESGVEAASETNQQEVANNLAKLSIRALARMAGYLEGDEATPDNPAVHKSLSAMLTPYVVRKFSKESAHDILKLLNSNTENPYMIWDNATRAELLEFLERQQKMKIKTGDCDGSFGADFQFTLHSKELVVGEIFVRVYNEQSTFALEEPHKFGAALIDYLGSQAQYLHSLMALTASEIDTSKTGGHKDRLDRIGMALEALRNVIRNSPGVETRCIGHFKLLFSLLRLTGAAKLQQLALEVIASVTGNSKCVANIADADVLAYLLLIIHTLPSSRLVVIETLHALMSNTKVVKEAMTKGAVIYLLELFCNSTNPNVRSRTAELFSKMMADKLIGPKVKIALSKFLPTIFMDAMRDSPEASVHMFEANHENPELIWNDEAREKVSAIVKQMKDRHYLAQKDDPYVTWKLPDDFSIIFDDVQGELMVGGVFLRLYISQPNWVLRKPKEFMVSLMDKFVNLTKLSAPKTEELETVTQAVVCLFSAQPPLADQVPALGHIPQIFQVMASNNNAIPKSALQVIHVLSDNELCVRTMSQTDSMRLIMVAMRARPDCMNIAAEALNRMFEKSNSELVAQSVRTELVQFLLRILDSLLTEVKNPSGTKAQIVKALKAMCRDMNYGEQVNQILEASSVWSAFRDQKHDLFISDSITAGYLTGPVGVAGYLTQGSGSNAALSSAPPPIDSQEHADS